MYRIIYDEKKKVKPVVGIDEYCSNCNYKEVCQKYLKYVEECKKNDLFWNISRIEIDPYDVQLLTYYLNPTFYYLTLYNNRHKGFCLLGNNEVNIKGINKIIILNTDENNKKIMEEIINSKWLINGDSIPNVSNDDIELLNNKINEWKKKINSLKSWSRSYLKLSAEILVWSYYLDCINTIEDNKVGENKDKAKVLKIGKNGWIRKYEE